MKNYRAPVLSFVVVVSLVLGAACSRQGSGAEGGTTVATHHHEHHAPHGGTAVVLGAEAYHLELVRDAATGTLQAYVLDGELENFVRISVPGLEMDVMAAGVPRVLVFRAVANSATGETIGDTALFEVQAEWLKTMENFDGTLRSITIRGTTFTDVKFNFPLGNE